MRRRYALLGSLLALGLLLSCDAARAPPSKTPLATPDRSESESAGVAIQVTSNGWHTDIVVAQGEAVRRAIPEVADFPDARYLSFGWGDAEFFPAPRPTIGMTLRAALQPSPALVHLAGLSAPPRMIFPSAEVVELALPRQGFGALLRYLEASFERGGAPRAAPAAPGLYRFSRFYPATGEFHLFNTSNTRTARGLAAAGLAVEVSGTQRAEALMSQVRRLAEPEPLP